MKDWTGPWINSNRRKETKLGREREREREGGKKSHVCYHVVILLLACLLSRFSVQRSWNLQEDRLLMAVSNMQTSAIPELMTMFSHLIRYMLPPSFLPSNRSLCWNVKLISVTCECEGVACEPWTTVLLSKAMWQVSGENLVLLQRMHLEYVLIHICKSIFTSGEKITSRKIATMYIDLGRKLNMNIVY